MLMYNFFFHNNKQNQRKISVLNIFLPPEKSPRTGSLINIVETVMFAVIDNIKLESYQVDLTCSNNVVQALLIWQAFNNTVITLF